MRVLHILNELKPSGVEVMLYTAAPYWHEQGLEGHILCTGSVVGEYAAKLEEAGYNINHIPLSRSHDFLLSVYRFLKQQHYDAIHIHTERANFWYALLAFISGNRCIIRSIQNVFPFRTMLRLKRFIQRGIMQRILGVKMVSASPSVKYTEWKTFRNPSVVIPNWFDSSTFKPPSRNDRYVARKTLGISNDVMIITSVGGCWSFKNHSSIIEAVARLPKAASILYLHVGPEMDGHPERRLAETMGASDRVRFLGSVINIAPILYASDVYAMCSFYEGFGVAATEAMGAGLPAILSDVPGLRDFREVCKDIYWVEPTPESTLEAIHYFLDLPASDRREAGLRLSSCVHRHYGVKAGAGAYGQLYRNSKH